MANRTLSLVLIGALSFVTASKLAFAQGVTATAPPPPNDTLLAAADDIARQVAALRELPLRRPLQRGVLSRTEIGEKLKERLAKDYAPEEIKAEAAVLRRLGLLPVDADYEKLMVDLLMEQIAGFYDPFTKKLFIADWLGLEMQRPALAHEIQHALQDQHFDLKKFATPIKDDSDRQLARAALVEGDATAGMLEFQLRAMGMPTQNLPELVAQMGSKMLEGSMGSMPLFDKAPAYMRETLIFPYMSGLTFVMALRRNNAPWSRIDDAFKKPPESTEQILHVEKYTQGEAPQKIVTSPLPSLGALHELRRDVYGELGCRLLLRDTAIAAADIERACAGWGGDRIVAYTGSNPAQLPTVIMYWSWDTTKDADEAMAAFGKWLDKHSGAAATPGTPSSSFRRDPNGAEWSLTRTGMSIAIVVAAPAGSHPAIVGEIERGWHVGTPVAPRQ